MSKSVKYLPAFLMGMGILTNVYAGAQYKNLSTLPSITIEQAISIAFHATEKVPDHAIRGLKITFVRDGSTLLKGYRGTVPPKVKSGRPYWDVSFDYFKTDSTELAFGGRIIIDAITGDQAE